MILINGKEYQFSFEWHHINGYILIFDSKVDKDHIHVNLDEAGLKIFREIIEDSLKYIKDNN